MNKIYWTAAFHLTLGLLGGLYFRELTKAYDFTGPTQLSVVHTHLLTLGAMFFVIVLLLEKVFALSASKWFGPFFWTYNAGLVVTVAMLTTHGTSTVLGQHTGAAISGIAGIGHILLTLGFVFLFMSLRSRLPLGESGARRDVAADEPAR